MTIARSTLPTVHPTLPPPPPSGQPGAPSPGWGAAPSYPSGPYGAPPGAGAPGYGGPAFGGPAYGGPPPGYGGQPTKPPRPPVTVASILIIAGACIVILGTFLPWISGAGQSFNGWDLAEFQEQADDSSSAAGYVGLAVIVGGFGIALLAARRVLAVAILAVIFASLTAVAAAVDLVDALDTFDELGIDLGVGLYVITVGALVALAGSIWALSVRRTWR